MSTTTTPNNNEDLELEEGEIAEDSNDACSLSNDEADVAPADLDNTVQGGITGGISCESGPQKKRKKVVRKVRRKIKVKKKVVRKKGGSGNNEGGGGGGGTTAGASASGGGGNGTGAGTGAGLGVGSNANVDNKMNSLLTTTMNNIHQPMLPSTTPLLPHIAQQTLDPNLMLNSQTQHHHIQHQQQHHHQQYQNSNNQNHLHLLPQIPQQQQQPQQHLQQSQTSSTQLDSLWEQQILVLQELQRQQLEDQQLNQILRAASTDEDLRIFPSPLTMLANNSNQQPIGNQLITSIGNTNITAVATSITNATATNTTIAATTTTTAHSPSKPMILHSQTPSSPDDENGKSSYEAISKMLALLRNSANVSDSSENTEIDNNHHFNPHQTTEESLLQTKQSQTGKIEYSLIPILIEGIDYTKYKLLSQYEPKFKNDPRLTQQT